MGGGVSGLFYGTKGSQREYQYTLFGDDSKTSPGGTVKISSIGAHQSIREKIISVEMVLKKCQKYRDGILTAHQLVQWLVHITVGPQYNLQNDLLRVITTALHNFSTCNQQGSQYNIEAFNLALDAFEQELERLL